MLIADLLQEGVKNMSHGDLYEKAKEAISKLFSDNSVTQETTRSSLEALIECTRTWLDALDAIDEALLN